MPGRARGAILAFALFLVYGTLRAQTPPFGSEFQVNTTTEAEQRDPKIAPLGNGFVVVWTDYGGDGSGVRVAGRIFDGKGNSVGGEIQINTYTTGDAMAKFIANAFGLSLYAP